MTSEVLIYQIPDLLEENNFAVEKIDEYLRLFGPILTLTNFQWQRLESSKEIKIDYNQAMDSPLFNRQPNYVRISSQGMNPAYYFVESISQRAKETISLRLKLDVLNTFFVEWPHLMTRETYIGRGFKDRFRPCNLSGDAFQLANIFDRVPEGDSFPLVNLGISKTVFYDQRGGDSAANPLKFYLVYRTANDGRPALDLCANRELKISESSMGGDPYEFTPAMMEEGRIYYLIGEFDATLQRVYAAQSITINRSDGLLKFQKVLRGGQYYIAAAWISDDGMESGLDDGTGQVDVVWAKLTITKGRQVYYSDTVDTYDAGRIRNLPYIRIDAGTLPAEYLGSIDALDKTDSRLVKVVECPYCPIDYSYDSTTGIYNFNRSYFSEVSENEYPAFFRSYNLGKTLPSVIFHSSAAPGYFRQNASKSEVLALKNSPSAPLFDDPKLFTSTYFFWSFVYDSFSKQIKLEDYSLPSGYALQPCRLYVSYKQSSNVSSALMFHPTIEEGIVLNRSEENYPGILTASRNNEMALFSSEYLNYLRNGYNYDKKKREENIAFNATMAGLQTAGAIVSFLLSGATGGLSAVGGIGLATGAATSFANLGMSAYQSGQDLDQKINLLKAQSYAVSGIDDLDLFNEYGKNKLTRYTYHLKEQDEIKVVTKFRNFGYKVDTYADPYEAGGLDSRFNFNYIQCDPVWRENSIPADFLGEISEKLRAGVWIWHQRFYLINGADNYRLNREYENIEMSVLDYLEAQS